VILVNRHGKGLIRQDPATALVRKPVTDHEAIMGALKVLSGNADLTAFIWRVLNQGLSETCWAHSAAQAKFVVDAIRTGVASAVMSSPLYFAQLVYAIYRAQATPPGQPLPGPGLQDGGAMLDDACTAFARFGWQPFGAPQQDGGTDVPATQDDAGNPILLPELTVPETEHAASQPFGGSYDIQVGSGAGDLVAASLEAGRPVWFGTSVGQAFQALTAGQIAQPTPADDSTAGGHAMLFLGYKTEPVNGSQTRLYRAINSWGKDWCDGGFYWASEAFVETVWSALPFEDVT
jgi:hypothetical protein